jgi:hypothetical protein
MITSHVGGTGGPKTLPTSADILIAMKAAKKAMDEIPRPEFDILVVTTELYGRLCQAVEANAVERMDPLGYSMFYGFPIHSEPDHSRVFSRAMAISTSEPSKRVGFEIRKGVIYTIQDGVPATAADDGAE